jgi:hypothetical protein
MISRMWRKATLGDAARDGDPITVWCNNRACSYWLEHGRQYRAILTPADLTAYVEKYGAETTFLDIRDRLRCRHCGSGEISTIVDRDYVSPKERWEREAAERPAGNRAPDL